MHLYKKLQHRIGEWEKMFDRAKMPNRAKTIVWGNKKGWEKTFDAIDDWICIVDLESSIFMSNRAVEKYFQINVQESIGMTCCKLIHGTDAPVEGCPLPRMLKTKKRESAEVKILDNRWMMITVDPIFNEAGDIISAVHITHDITQRISIRKEREQLVKDLKKAVTQIKTLSGLIPICSSCKKIRDDKGYWELIESYIESHSEASFSHGLCPECSDTLYGDENWYLEMKQKKKDTQ